MNTTKILLTTPYAYDNSQDNKNTTRIAPKFNNLHNNHPLSLVSRNYTNTAIT